MKKIGLVAGLMLAICLVFGGTGFAGPDGVYAVKMQGSMDERDCTIAINADGSGYFEDMMSKSEFKGGKIEGNNFDIPFTANTPMGEMEMTLKGTVDGDKITGTCTNAMGDFTFAGERKK